jgi:diguanylate cyclase (GGDEF)-like protein
MERTNRTLDALEAQVKGLEDLIEIAGAVVSTLDVDTVLQAVLRSAMRFAETPAGSVVLLDEEKNEVCLVAHEGLSSEFVSNERSKIVPGGFTEQALRAREMICIGDIPYEQIYRVTNSLMLREGIKSLICIPLILNQSIIGILYLYDFVPRVFDKEKLKLLSVFVSFAAVAIENAKLHNSTKMLAITDFLTGLYNYRYFVQKFNQEIDRAERYKKPLSIVMMDVDDFKAFNDTFGHSIGDQVLVKVGEIINATLRKVDFAFRYGGEEFAILLPETDVENACLLAERLRGKIEQETIGAFGVVNSQSVTVSIGVASYPDDGTTMDEVFKQVDELMYKAKKLGKNRVYSGIGESGENV